jgi:methionyl-tRNA synthetase
MMNSTFGYTHGYSMLYGFGPGPALFMSIVLSLLLVCLIILKGYALWFAAKRDQKWWFIALLVINSVGILEIIYIVFFVKEYHKKLKK